MKTIDRSKPVMVTGATGYVAGWLVKKLLDEGLAVHAAVREPNNLEKIKPLQALADNVEGSIRFFKADLLTEGCYSEAMQGCELVFHTASPFILDTPDPQRNVIDPAVNGTRNVLASVNQTQCVKRVIITGSVTAIYDTAKDVEDTPENKFTEAVWNTRSSIDNNPYFYSKVLAEKAAWEMTNAQNHWDMIVINPAFVVGPAIGSSSTSDSFNILTQMGDGTMKSGVPAYCTALVDVRDVAEAHFSAAFTPRASGRYIISAHDSNFFEIAQVLYKKYGDQYPIPNKKLPKFILWLLGPIISKGLMTRRSVSRNIEIDYHFDNRKSINELEVNYRSQEESLLDMFQHMIDNNYFKTG